MSQQTGILFYDQTEGRQRVAVLSRSPRQVFDDLAAWSGLSDFGEYLRLHDRERHTIWRLYAGRYGRTCEVGEWPTDIPAERQIYCSSCLTERCLPLFLVYGVYGEPLAVCEACADTLALAFAAEDDPSYTRQNAPGVHYTFVAV